MDFDFIMSSIWETELLRPFLVLALGLIVAGALGVASLIIKKKPEAAEIIGKIAPFQGIIGIGLLIMGVINLLQAFRLLDPQLGTYDLGTFLTSFGAILYLATPIICILLGFILGFNLIAKFLGEKGEAIFIKLAGFQGIFGILAVLLGIFCMLAYFRVFDTLLFSHYAAAAAFFGGFRLF